MFSEYKTIHSCTKEMGRLFYRYLEMGLDKTVSFLAGIVTDLIDEVYCACSIWSLI
jgi:hypothetical protein